MSVKKDLFGKTPDGLEVWLYTITNAKGSYAQIINYGASLQALFVPDKNGNLIDVTIGFDDLESHMTLSDYQGQTVGRFANRIKGGRFSLNGKEYRLTQNEDNGNCLHGGGEFSHAVWDYVSSDDESVSLGYVSIDGSHGFPGNLDCRVKYSFNDEDELRIDFYAISDEDTIVSLTNHAYFNLGGPTAGDVLEHSVFIDADYFTPTDENNIPTGQLKPVAGTPFDFTVPKTLGRDINLEDEQLISCKGYDHNFCLNKRDVDEPCATAYNPQNGIMMKVYTDLPGLQLYTGNFLKGISGKGGHPMGPRQGFCFETQFYPDTPNQPDFPQCVYKAGESFESTTTFAFTVE
ncbi:MAG TPA: aldose epimerase family protein [Clostridiales bacterium]|jgi:aldose 1-epimerase|nr:aldose epimerase family protein [Clostridiales bacterium]